MKLSSILRSSLIFLTFTVFGNQAFGQQAPEDTVLAWNNVAIKTASSNNSSGLLMVRALAIMHTAMYDAWAQYETSAIPTEGTPLRRPGGERTLANKQAAISYAAFRVLSDLFPADMLKLEREMISLGYDPKNKSRDRTTSSGIGLLAGDLVLDDRHHDGANQLGDLHPGAYSDYTRYATANTPDLIRDPDRWQPLDQGEDGKASTQQFDMPQWGQVKPFGFDSVLDVRPQATPKSLRSDPAD